MINKRKMTKINNKKKINKPLKIKPGNDGKFCVWSKLQVTVYILGQYALNYSLALVYLIPSWLVWAEINCTCGAFCSTQTAHTPVETSLAKQTTVLIYILTILQILSPTKQLVKRISKERLINYVHRISNSNSYHITSSWEKNTEQRILLFLQFSQFEQLKKKSQ